MGFDPTWRVHTGGVDLEPALAGFVVRTPNEGGTANIGDFLYGLFGGQAVCNLDDGALGVAIQKKITFRVDHNGAANLVLPIVVMRNAPQRALDTAQDDGHVAIRFAAALAVHNGCTVGPLAARIPCGIGIVSADLAVSRVPVDHGIHVARRHAKKQVGPAQGLERVCALPIRLRQNAHPETLHFQHAPDHGHAKAGMVDIGVARHNDDVAAVPTQRCHFSAVDRKKLGSAKAGRPVLSVAGQRFCRARKQRNVSKDAGSCSHGEAWVGETSFYGLPG